MHLLSQAFILLSLRFHEWITLERSVTSIAVIGLRIHVNVNSPSEVADPFWTDSALSGPVVIMYTSVHIFDTPNIASNEETFL